MTTAEQMAAGQRDVEQHLAASRLGQELAPELAAARERSQLLAEEQRTKAREAWQASQPVLRAQGAAFQVYSQRPSFIDDEARISRELREGRLGPVAADEQRAITDARTGKALVDFIATADRNADEIVGSVARPGFASAMPEPVHREAMRRWASFEKETIDDSLRAIIGDFRTARDDTASPEAQSRANMLLEDSGLKITRRIESAPPRWGRAYQQVARELASAIDEHLGVVTHRHRYEVAADFAGRIKAEARSLAAIYRSPAADPLALRIAAPTLLGAVKP